MINQDFSSILELIKAFPDEQSCIDHLEALRWGGKVVSPFDGESLPCVTAEQAEEIIGEFAAKNQTQQSSFNERLKQALNFDPKK